MKANKKELYKHVDYLTGIEPARNYRNMDSLNRSADYIYSELGEYGCRTEEQTFKVDGNIYRNIIGSVGPKDAPRIIVGAHYDVAGDQPGADDNASAVAGLLETAWLIAPLDQQLKKRIDFVAYSLEEPPFFGSSSMGSAVHADSLKENEINVEFMVCYEMIGYFSDEPGSQKFPSMMPEMSGIDVGNFIIVVGIERYRELAGKIASLMRQNTDLRVESLNFPSPHGMVGLSDHSCYWRNGYPAVMLTDTSFLRNPNYHQETDTIDTLDFNRMASVITGMTGALRDVATR